MSDDSTEVIHVFDVANCFCSVCHCEAARRADVAICCTQGWDFDPACHAEPALFQGRIVEALGEFQHSMINIRKGELNYDFVSSPKRLRSFIELRTGFSSCVGSV